MKLTRAIGFGSLLIAMLVSFDAQRSLAMHLHFPEHIAWGAPVAIDLYLLWAVRSRRDVAIAVSVSMAANVASVSLAGDMSAGDTVMAALLHATFPAIVWRTERRSAVSPAPELNEAAKEPQKAVQTHSRHVSVPTPAPMPAEKPAKAAAATSANPPDVAAAYHALSAGGRTVTGRMLAEHFGVSERTGRRYLQSVSDGRGT